MKKISLARCPECRRKTPYSLKGLDYFKNTIQCRRCGTSILIREMPEDQLNIDLWEEDVLERARRTYNQCKRMLLIE